MRRPQPICRRTFLTGLSDLGMAGLIVSTGRSIPRPPPHPQSLRSALRAEPRLELDRLTCSDFARHVGEPFLVASESGSTLSLKLHEAKVLRSQARSVPGLAARPPFSVVFRGPVDFRLEQGIHRVRHPRLGTLDLFLVPIGPRTDGDAASYEAIFG